MIVHDLFAQILRDEFLLLYLDCTEVISYMARK